MNFVLCFMLMNAGGNEKDAWKCIFSLFYCSQWMLYGIYMVEFPLLQMLAKLTRKILEEKEHALYSKLKLLDIDDSFLINKWILTLYLYNTQTKTVLHFWDEILAKGIFVIASINVALLK